MDGLESVAGDEVVFPVFRGVATGLSWALWAVRSSATSWTAAALRGGVGRLVLDKHVPPVASPSEPAGSVYADNVVILGLNVDSVDSALRAVMLELDQRGIQFQEVEDPSAHFTSVGVVFDGERRLLRHSDARAWWLYLACAELQRLGAPRALGQLRVFLGHCVLHCLLLRPVLSVFRHLYAFVDSDDSARPPPSEALHEIAVFKGLIFQAVVRFEAPMADLVLCSDSSGSGYALHRRRAGPALLRRLSQVPERRRFVPDDKRAYSADDAFTAGWLPGAGGVLGDVVTGPSEQRI